MEACKLKLPQSLSLSSPEVSSLLFDPHSLSLALLHSDSSFSLYPSLSPLPLSSLPPPQTLIPPPTSSATFLRLQNPNPNSTPHVLFIVSAPLRGGTAVLLRFWILHRNSQSFTKSRVICNQKELKFDDRTSGVVFSVNHGVSIKLVGSINVFAMYSVSSSKIWVFAAKMVDGDEDRATLKLMKCAVIDCCAPVFAVSVSFGFLILGEENGVRVFPLRPLVKGRANKHRRENMNFDNGAKNAKFESGKMKLPNGLIPTINGTGVSHCKMTDDEGTMEISSNGYLEGKFLKHHDSVKLRSVKLRQDSKEWGACFVAFKNKESKSYKHIKELLQLAKASSIQALSPDTFLILDSAGDLHLLCLSNPALAPEIPFHIKQLTNTLKVQKLAVLPDILTRTQNFWISDGHHTVHAIAVPDADASISESDRKDCEKKLIQSTVNQAIFTSEKIQEIVPLATNAVLILGQGALFAYAIS